MTNYTMTPEEALAAIPANAMNPAKLAQLLREVTSVARSDRARANAVLHLESHMALLKQLQGYWKLAPRGSVAMTECRRAFFRQYNTAWQFANRHGLPFESPLAP